MIYSENTIDKTHKRGTIEVVCGSMFSGKTEELLRRLKRAKIARQKVEIFKLMMRLYRMIKTQSTLHQ